MQSWLACYWSTWKITGCGFHFLPFLFFVSIVRKTEFFKLHFVFCDITPKRKKLHPSSSAPQITPWQVWKGGFMKHAWRRMKHILCLRALLVKHQNIWSGTACHEAKPFQASCFFALKSRQKKIAAGFFISTHHSEPHFELKTSEFRCEMNFWKSLHFQSEKLRIYCENKRKMAKAAKIFHFQYFLFPKVLFIK